ncbi:MAG: hypothetical protein B7X57_00575 [Erythrobacter sp. 34-65-8]|nr:MAG: hypothetical protein B7X57_00575 [Erythrobacter sp. 34-65-8]
MSDPGRRLITGFSNPTVKALRALREKKHRKAAGTFLAEGLRLLTDALECGHVPQVLVLASGRDPHPLLDRLEQAVFAAGGEVIETSADILGKITGKDNPQAVAGVYDEFDTSLAALDRAAAPIWLVAQALRDPGNLGTMLIALPVAVLVLKMGRETIGATFSVAREPNIAIIADKYGLKGPEGIGVMGVYVVGTMFGTLWFALMAGYLLSLDIFDPRALAMACGVGSGSMVAACSGALTAMMPEMGDSLLAFAGASNLLTYATGLYVCLFLALPMAEWLYKLLTRNRANSTSTDSALDATLGASVSDPDQERPEKNLGQTAVAVAIVCAVAWISNIVNGAPLMQALPGIIILYVMSMIGLGIARIMPFYLPSIAWVSLVSIIATVPGFPGSAWMVSQLSHVNFLAIVTPVLAYAGLALANREFTMFRKTGWKLIITALLVFTGTFLGSAIIAQIFL